MADQLPHGLDPKFQSVYDRVMGTPTAAGATPPTPSAPQPLPLSSQPSSPAPTPTQSGPTPSVSQTVVIPQIVPKQAPTPLGSSDTFSQGFVAGGDKKKGVSPVIVGLGVMVFFVVYTLFWIKVLNVQLPFLPQ